MNSERDRGFYDSAGGYHCGAEGYNPNGVWCDECSHDTCEGCKYEKEEG